MPFLKQQIEIINAELRESSLKDKRFQSGRFEAIAVDVSRENAEGGIETFPAVMNSSYEAEEITPNDVHPIIIYHKILGKGYQPAPVNSQYGDGVKSKIERTEMRMVVFGKYGKLQLTAEELEALITTGFPEAIAKTKLSGYKLDSMNVTLMSSNLNSAQVFQEEYKGIELFLSAEDIYFSVRYQIESRFRKGCFNICDCESGNTSIIT